MLFLFIATFFPVWTLWSINWMEGLGSRHSLWYVSWEIARAQLDPRFPSSVKVMGDSDDIGIAAIFFCIGCLFGIIFYTARRRLRPLRSQLDA